MRANWTKVAEWVRECKSCWRWVRCPRQIVLHSESRSCFVLRLGRQLRWIIETSIFERRVSKFLWTLAGCERPFVPHALIPMALHTARSRVHEFGRNKGSCPPTLTRTQLATLAVCTWYVHQTHTRILYHVKYEYMPGMTHEQCWLDGKALGVIILLITFWCFSFF